MIQLVLGELPTRCTRCSMECCVSRAPRFESSIISHRSCGPNRNDSYWDVHPMRHPQAPRSPELAIELLPGALLNLVLHVRLWEKPWFSKLLTWGRPKMERKRRQDHDPRIQKKQHQRLTNPRSSRKTSKRFFLSILWCTHSILHLDDCWCNLMYVPFHLFWW